MQTSERIFYTRAFALIALLLVGYLLYLVLSPFFAPIAWSLFIAFLIYPLHAWLTRRLRGRAARVRRPAHRGDLPDGDRTPRGARRGVRRAGGRPRALGAGVRGRAQARRTCPTWRACR